MRKLLPVLSLAAMGCAPEYIYGTQPPVSGTMNPRQLEGVTQVDTILQVTQPEVDVLWVVDDSCSMGDEQQRLGTNFPIFFDFFEGSGLDYHIGVVTTDMDAPARKGKLVTKNGERFITPETSAAATVFKNMTNLGTGGSADERGNEATYAALELERNAYNLGFLRENSGVHVIVVADEADYSTNITPEELASYLNGLRKDPDDVTFSGIVLANDVKYRAVSNAVGGIMWDVAEQDWTVVLEMLGLQAAGLKREYFLSQLPVPGTIEVWVHDLTGAELRFDEKEDWEYNPRRNSISFHTYVPEPMEEVVLKYEVLSSHHGE